MTPGTIAVLSLSMSTDAFAAAVGRGASHRPTLPAAVKAGLVFGVIEAITPLIGWGLGIIAAGLVERIDHWIAFTLLLIVGGKMIWEGAKPRDGDEGRRPPPLGSVGLDRHRHRHQHRRGGGRRGLGLHRRQYLGDRRLDRLHHLRP